MEWRILAAAGVAGGLLLGGASVWAQGTGKWTSGAAMPSERSEVAVATVDGKIYVVGGFGGQRELEIYDPATDRWERGAAFPRAVHHPAAAGLDGKIHVVGGYVDGWSPTDAVFEYDPAADRWRERAALPTPRDALAVAVLDGRIHAVGGAGEGRRNTPAHEAYDPATDRWTALAPIPTPRDHLAVAAVDGRLYAIGGRVDGSYARNLNTNEAYDPARRARPGRSMRSRPTIPSATTGAAMPRCRPRVTAWGRRSSADGCTSSRAGLRPGAPPRPPTRSSRRDRRRSGDRVRIGLERPDVAARDLGSWEDQGPSSGW